MVAKSKLCWVPYYSAEMTYLSVKPCCKLQLERDQLPYGSLQDFNSESAKSWRIENFERDQLSKACASCDVPATVYNYRQSNQRMFQRDGWQEPRQAQLRRLTVGMDNICASSCIQCGPYYSTTIGNLAERGSDQRRIMIADQPETGLQQVNLELLDGQIADLEILHLFGGEPFVSPNFARLLELVSNQSLKLKRITASTGLCRIKAGHLAQLAQLADRGCEIYILVSLDGPMELNSWIRGITETEFWEGWNLLVQHHPRIKISGFQTTLGAYNVFALAQYVDFVKELWLKLPLDYRTRVPLTIMSTAVIQPSLVCARQLPQQVKEPLKQQLAQALVSAPEFARELYQTALHHVSLPSNQEWTKAQERINAYGQWRGDSEHTVANWIEHFMEIKC